jgi:predicted dehydrogenase
MITDSPNERINVAVAGISGERPRVRGMIAGRGMFHIRGYSHLPNVTVTTICDVDERLFPAGIAEVEKLFGIKPRTEIDFREILDDKSIDVVSVATPDHWHALQTIWACQAGKDVYVEKPVSYNLSEGRKMVQAAEKYKRIVLGGMNYRFNNTVNEAIRLIHSGQLGKVYMAKAIAYNQRPSIGITKESPVPEGVHWDMFLGPAPFKPFSENRFLYTWHWMWDTGTSDLGNICIYHLDVARLALNKSTHPVSVNTTGGLIGRDDDQETPNFISSICEYDDGLVMHNEVRNISTNLEGSSNRLTIVYGDKGWMEISGNGFKTFFGPNNEPGPVLTDKDIPQDQRIDGWKEFISCVRSRKSEDLRNNILEGHMSASIVHLGLTSFRTRRRLSFDPATEKFPGDDEANRYLTRKYRPPYVIPEKI